MQQLWRTFGTVVPALVMLLPVMLSAAWALASRRGKKMPRKAAWRVSLLDVTLLLATLPVLYLTFVPITGLQGRTLISLTPGAAIVPIFGVDGSTPAASALVQALGNLALLAPLAALIPLRVARLRSIVRVVVAALLVSVTVELGQALLAVGRVSAIDDVILNSVGAALGALATRRWWRGATPAIDTVGLRAPESDQQRLGGGLVEPGQV